MRRLLRRLFQWALGLPLLGTILDQYSSLRHLKDRKVALLGLTNFLDTMSWTIIVPLLPTYADKIGASAFMIGIIFAAPSVVKAVFSAPFGHLADRFNRRLLMIVGIVLGGVSVIAIGFVGIPLAFVAFRALDGLALSMKGPATNAYIGDLVPEEDRGSVFGAYHTLGILGMAVGPALGGVISAFGGISAPFVVLGIGTVFGGLLLWAFLPDVERTDDADSPSESESEAETASPSEVEAEPQRDSESEPQSDSETGPQSDSESERDAGRRWSVSVAGVKPFLTAPILALLVGGFVSAIGTGAFYPFFSLILESNLSVGPAFVGLAWSVFGLGIFLFTPIGGTSTDRFGRKPILILGDLGWAVVALGLAFATVRFVPLALLFVGGAASALMGPAGNTLRYEIAPDGREATLDGMNDSLYSAGSALGPIVGGAVVQWYGVRVVFVGMGLLWILATLIIAAFVPETRTREESTQQNVTEA